MTAPELASELVAVWRRHDDILQALLAAIPRGGLAAVPSEGRGRDVGAVLFHLDRVRRGWLHLHATGERPRLPRHQDGKPPTKAQLKKALKASGKDVEAFLGQALSGVARVRMFGKSPARFLAYLLAHESHHRGQILLALKQNGKGIADQDAVATFWTPWITG